VTGVRRWRHGGFVILLLLCRPLGAFAAEPVDPVTNQSANPEQVQAELERLAEQLNSLDFWLSRAEERRLRLLADLREKDRAVASAVTEVEASDTVLARIEVDRAQLETERDRLKEKQSQEAARIGDHLAAAYRLRGQHFLRVLLDQGSVAPVQRLLVYHRYLITARLEALSSYRLATSLLEENAQALAAREAAERQERLLLVAHRRELMRSRAERRALIASLESDVQDRVSRREALLRDQGRLQTLFAELQGRFSAVGGADFAGRKGSLPWPLEGVLLSRFGEARAEGNLRWHGLLLRAETGSPVRAVHNGRVVFADWLRGFGLLTILDHGDGYMTLYGYAEMLAKRPGDFVEGGEVIARAGQSGGMQASGIYFEIREHGAATNPLSWVAGRG